jgi:hypothetical protein
MNKPSNSYSMAAALAVSAWVILASAYGCYLFPARTWPFGLALGLLAAAWLARQLASGEQRQRLTTAIVLAGLMLGVALLAPLGWSASMADRGMGILSGLLVVVCSNGIPKQPSSARGQILRRAAGWAMVLGGLAYALCWLLLPRDIASVAAPLALLAGLIYATVRIVWSRPMPVPPN